MDPPELSKQENKGGEAVFTKCGICGDPHYYRDCQYVVLTTKINNKEVPTRARLTLPDNLKIKKLADGTSSVFTQTLVDVGTEFGPFVAKRNLTLNPLITFPIKIFIDNESDLSEYYLDTTDENECCWMMFVNPASDVEEQNLICFQEGGDIYFGAIKDIHPGEEFKVWYSPYYAFKMQKSTLSFKESFKKQIESEMVKKETEELNTIIKQQQKIVPRIVWNCKFCYKLEKNVTDFAKHLQSHYNLDKRRVCQECKQKFTYIKDYRKHMNYFHGDSLVKKDKSPKYRTTKIDDRGSKKCSVTLKSNSVGGPLLLQFLNDSLDNSNLLLQQPEVNLFEVENYENQNVLLDSENLHLNIDVIGSHNIKDLDDFNNSENKPKEAEKEEFVCDVCLKKFASVKAINKHLNFHIGNYFCSSCKKVFGRLENLKRHKCNQVYSLKCPKCDKIFYQQKYLTKHLSVVHDKKYRCTACYKQYFSASDLANHVCASVSKEKRRHFKCKLCEKVFFKEVDLKRHEKRHTNEEPKTVKQICALCSGIFYSDLGYRRHLRTVHMKYMEHLCQICDKRFGRKDSLQDHIINIHMGISKIGAYKCTKCAKGFKTKRALGDHVNSIHNNSTRQCHCGATFKFSRNLARHKKIHERDDIVSVAEHKCPMCDTKVKLKRSLTRHMRQKHPGAYKDLHEELNNKRKKNKTPECPVCHEKGKFVERHMLKCHPKEYKYFRSCFLEANRIKKTKENIGIDEDDIDNYIDTDQKCMDLQKTIENMDFSMDICNDNLLSGSETIDKFLKESSEQISILFADSPYNSKNNEQKSVVFSNSSSSALDTATTIMTDRISNREVCLSMPDLEMDQEIKLGKNAYISANGNIVEPQEDPSNVVVYVLNEKRS